MITCKKCKLQFSKIPNLRTHVRNKHPDELDILAPLTKQSKSDVPCTECNKKFANVGSVRAHMKKQHPDKLSSIKKNKYTCSHCLENFALLKDLVVHKRSHKTQSRFKCSVCNYCGLGHENLILHYRNEHFFTIENENLQFDSFEDFQLWKLKVEEKSYASFVNRSGKKTKKHSTLIVYNCHRSGEFQPKSKNIRKLKAKGSNKIGSYCPARIVIKINENNKCQVKFCKSHIGHKQKEDIRHLFLSKHQKIGVATKIAAKVPFKVILDEVRDSGTNGDLERLHLLTKKDLYNIEQCFHLNASPASHENDDVNVEAWVTEMKTTGTVLFYKHQDSLCENYPQLRTEDFVLVIMTDYQKKLLLRFGDDCVCIDGTHDLNGNGFQLHTILVLDDLREGYPCSFLISNRSDTTVMTIFYKCIEEKAGRKIKPNIFMSDMAEAYYSAWKQVMQPANLRLWCTWGVDKAWKNNLEKVTNKEKKVQIYQMIRTLLQERDVATFNKLVSTFITDCREDPDLFQFGDNFKQQYVCNAQQWAYCYRLNTGLDTYTNIERIYRTINHLYLDGKFVQRLDNAIGAIMKFVRNKSLEQLRVLPKGNMCTKLSDLKNNHETSETLDIDSIIETETGWAVLSECSKEIYNIEEINPDCQCKLTCEDCCACLHQYACTCIDSLIKWNMCKHIHLVCKYIKKKSVFVMKKEILLPVDDYEPLIMETTDEYSLLEEVSFTTIDDTTLEEAKTKLILEVVQQINEIKSLEELNIIKKNLISFWSTQKKLNS